MILRLVEHSMRVGSTVARRYNVTAYAIRETKTGKKIYYKHHDVLTRVPWRVLKEEGYEDLPLGGLHNHSVEEEVMRRLDGVGN